MKKVLAFIMTIVFAVCVIGCTCTNNQPTTPVEKPTLGIVDTLGAVMVEQTVALDRQNMFNEFGEDYRWFETCVTLSAFLDSDEDVYATGVANVFQVVEDKENGADVFVILTAHTAEASTTDVKHGFWVEDLPLNDEAVVITFEQALERVYEANLPKPHSKQVVLRKELGPIAANPQWIFGNVRAQIYVDAVTGEVSSDNPVYPKAKGFTMPLGEWP